MIDKTTEGFDATPDEIEGMLRNLCAYALSEPDPLERYLDLTHQQVLFDGLVAAIRRERGKALHEMMTMGAPIAKVAEVANLESPQRVKQLITGAGLTVPVHKPGKRAAVVPKQRTGGDAEPPASTGSSGRAESTAHDAPVGEEPPTHPAPPAARHEPPVPAAPAAPAPADRHVVHVAQAEGLPPRNPARAELPDSVAVPAKRTLTEAERLALGLPASGPIPQTFDRLGKNPVRSR